MAVGYCTACDQGNKLVGPLHLAKGGPLVCIPCGTDWHAKHTRVRKLGRIIVKATKAYLKAGGDWSALDRLKLAASGVALYAGEADTIGAEVGDITAELLEDTIRLTHPDRHPTERQDAARRVTQELLALKPYVFPAPKAEPTPPTVPRDASDNARQETESKPLRIEYPCELCADQVPYYYCKACTAEHDKRWQKKEDLRKAKQRAWYKARRARQLLRQRKATCPVCKAEFRSKRKDARYCSAACRQHAHRIRVTDKNKCNGALGSIRYMAAAESAEGRHHQDAQCGAS
jgi:hypothetical protein